MILLFDDGGDKITNLFDDKYAVGKMSVNNIWVTDLTGISGTKYEQFETIEEAILYLGSKGPAYSPVSFESGIPVVEYCNQGNSDDPEVVLVRRYRINSHNKIEKETVAKSFRLEEFKENWNNYQNTGIPTDPTNGWVDYTFEEQE